MYIPSDIQLQNIQLHPLSYSMTLQVILCMRTLHALVQVEFTNAYIPSGAPESPPLSSHSGTRTPS